MPAAEVVAVLPSVRTACGCAGATAEADENELPVAVVIVTVVAVGLAGGVQRSMGGGRATARAVVATLLETVTGAVAAGREVLGFRTCGVLRGEGKGECPRTMLVLDGGLNTRATGGCIPGGCLAIVAWTAVAWARAIWSRGGLSEDAGDHDLSKPDPGVNSLGVERSVDGVHECGEPEWPCGRTLVLGNNGVDGSEGVLMWPLGSDGLEAIKCGRWL